MSKKFVYLSNTVQNYEWGKIGQKSLVCQLKQSDYMLVTNSRHETMAKFDPEKPYSELWIGTHPKGCSQVYQKKGKLTDLPDLIKKRLPYLFKILSIKDVLSIQTHPFKSQAVVLHQESPNNYPDDQPKPEMLVAIDKVEILCGFRSVDEIMDIIKLLPPLSNLFGLEKNISDITIKTLFENLVACDENTISKCFEQLAQIIEEKNNEFFVSNPRLSELFTDFNKKYPNDVGCAMLFIMNYYSINEGECVYTVPNTPHAYISGDLFECMNSSDNTIRLGLTPKFKDVPAIFKNLTFKEFQKDTYFLKPDSKIYKNVMVSDYKLDYNTVKNEVDQNEFNQYYNFTIRTIKPTKAYRYKEGIKLTCPLHSCFVCVRGEMMFDFGYETYSIQKGQTIFFLEAVTLENVIFSKDSLIGASFV